MLQVLIVGDEDKNPYSRPPLSKELWYGEKTGLVTKQSV